MSKPVFEKLQLNEEKRALLINSPDNYHSLIKWPNNVKLNLQESELDFVHIFSNSLMELKAQIGFAKKRIKQNGVIWVSYYKQASKKETELNSNLVRELIINMGLVDNKVCSINLDWTALRAVLRLKDRTN